MPTLPPTGVEYEVLRPLFAEAEIQESAADVTEYQMTIIEPPLPGAVWIAYAAKFVTKMPALPADAGGAIILPAFELYNNWNRGFDVGWYWTYLDTDDSRLRPGTQLIPSMRYPGRICPHGITAPPGSGVPENAGATYTWTEDVLVPNPDDRSGVEPGEQFQVQLPHSTVVTLDQLSHGYVFDRDQYPREIETYYMTDRDGWDSQDVNNWNPHQDPTHHVIFPWLADEAAVYNWLRHGYYVVPIRYPVGQSSVGVITPGERAPGVVRRRNLRTVGGSTVERVSL